MPIAGNVYESSDPTNGADRSVLVGRNKLIDSEKTYTWANSASATTVVSNTFTPPTILQASGLYVIHVRNPSSVTALTLILYNVENLGGSDRDCELARFFVPVSSVRAFIVQGWMLGSANPKLSITNDTVLGGSDGFSATVRVRAL